MKLKFVDCLMSSGTDWLAVAPTDSAGRIEFIGCEIGTLTDPPIASCAIDYYGASGAISSLTTYAVDVAAMTATYRVGSKATGGVRANPVCWPMIADADRTTEGIVGHRSLPLESWVEGDGSAQTATVYFAHAGIGDGTAGRLETDQIWVEIISGNDAAANSKGILTTSRPDPKASISDITDDSSTWVGAAVGTKQKIEITISPDLQGPARAVVVFAPGDASDTTVFIDPILYIT